MLGKRPRGLPKGVYVHPLALLESAQVGDGTRVWGFSHVMKGARIGEQCNICEHVFVEAGVKLGDRVTVKNGISLWHGVEVADDVFLGPHAVFTNDLIPRAFVKRGPEALVPTKINRGATIGAGAVVVCGHTIGAYAFVAAGAVITRDIPEHALVMGNPAKIRGWICRCGDTRVGVSAKKLSCPKCKTQKNLKRS